MFSSSYFEPSYFNEYFKITPTDIVLPDDLGGSAAKVVDYKEIRKLNLDRDDQDILEFIVAFVTNQQE